MGRTSCALPPSVEVSQSVSYKNGNHITGKLFAHLTIDVLKFHRQELFINDIVRLLAVPLLFGGIVEALMA